MVTKFFVGCDMSKQFFDVAYRQENGAVKYLNQFKNSTSGYRALIKCLKSITDYPPSSWFICFENTGSYSKAFLKFLCEQEIPRREENALLITKSMGIRRGKNDSLDAKTICQYVFEKRDTITPNQLDTSDISKLKKLLSYRDLLVKSRTALKVSLKDINPNLDLEFVNDLTSTNTELILRLKEKINEIEKKIKDLLTSDSIKKSYKLVSSVIGIGDITSAYFIAFTNNFQSFNDSRKFACYSGVAPFPNSSGLFKGKDKVSHLANKKIKSILSQCSTSAIRFDPQIKSYYIRKAEQGKAPGVIFNAVKNKLIHRVFAVIKRQTPYVKILTYV